MVVLYFTKAALLLSVAMAQVTTEPSCLMAFLGQATVLDSAALQADQVSRLSLGHLDLDKTDGDFGLIYAIQNVLATDFNSYGLDGTIGYHYEDTDTYEACTKSFGVTLELIRVLDQYQVGDNYVDATRVEIDNGTDMHQGQYDSRTWREEDVDIWGPVYLNNDAVLGWQLVIDTSRIAQPQFKAVHLYYALRLHDELDLHDTQLDANNKVFHFSVTMVPSTWYESDLSVEYIARIPYELQTSQPSQPSLCKSITDLLAYNELFCDGVLDIDRVDYVWNPWEDIYANEYLWRTDFEQTAKTETLKILSERVASHLSDAPYLGTWRVQINNSDIKRLVFYLDFTSGCFAQIQTNPAVYQVYDFEGFRDKAQTTPLAPLVEMAATDTACSMYDPPLGLVKFTVASFLYNGQADRGSFITWFEDKVTVVSYTDPTLTIAIGAMDALTHEESMDVLVAVNPLNFSIHNNIRLIKVRYDVSNLCSADSNAQTNIQDWVDVMKSAGQIPSQVYPGGPVVSLDAADLLSPDYLTRLDYNSTCAEFPPQFAMVRLVSFTDLQGNLITEREDLLALGFKSRFQYTPTIAEGYQSGDQGVVLVRSYKDSTVIQFAAEPDYDLLGTYLYEIRVAVLPPASPVLQKVEFEVQIDLATQPDPEDDPLGSDQEAEELTDEVVVEAGEDEYESKNYLAPVFGSKAYIESLEWVNKEVRSAFEALIAHSNGIQVVEVVEMTEDTAQGEGETSITEPEEETVWPETLSSDQTETSESTILEEWVESLMSMSAEGRLTQIPGLEEAAVDLQSDTLDTEAIVSLLEKIPEDAPTSFRQAIFNVIMQTKLELAQKAQRPSGLDGEEEPEQAFLDLAFENIESTGQLPLYFSGGMAGLAVIKQLDVQVESRGIVSYKFADEFDEEEADIQEYQTLRRLQGRRRRTFSVDLPSESDETVVEPFDLSQYIQFEVRRGEEDSADPSDLGFTVTVDDLGADRMYFKVSFDNPASVSTGSKKDVLFGTVIDESFFQSEDAENPAVVQFGKDFRATLPRMLLESQISQVEAAEEGIKNTVQPLLTGQVILTLVLSVSLKQMWNLFNVMQIVVYARNFTPWPAFVNKILQTFFELIYLEEITAAVLDFGKTKFEVAMSVTKDDYLRSQDLNDDSVIKNLGIFTISFAIIAGIIVLYFLIILCCKKIALCKSLSKVIKDHVFFSGPYRYIIVSYLKLFNQFFVLLMMGIANMSGAVYISGGAVPLLVLLLWPLFTIWLLLKYQSRLVEPHFQRRHNSLYQGIKTHSQRALLYHGVFAARRLNLILLNTALTAQSPLTGVGRSQYSHKILAFLGVQTGYLAYVHLSRPHAETLFNVLEFVNEYSTVLLAYAMLNFTTLGVMQDPITSKTVTNPPAVDNSIEQSCIGLIILMAVVNLSVMIILSLKKVILSLKRKKSIQLAKTLNSERLQKLAAQTSGLKGKNEIKPSDELIVVKEEDSHAEDDSDKGGSNKLEPNQQGGGLRQSVTVTKGEIKPDSMAEAMKTSQSFNLKNKLTNMRPTQGAIEIAKKARHMSLLVTGAPRLQPLDVDEVDADSVDVSRQIEVKQESNERGLLLETAQQLRLELEADDEDSYLSDQADGRDALEQIEQPAESNIFPSIFRKVTN